MVWANLRGRLLKSCVHFTSRYSAHLIVHFCLQWADCAQVLTYPSLSPVNAISGVISPTTLSLIASPMATPRTTPRSTPIPRWTTPFIPLDENVDYSMLANIMPTVNADESLLSEGGSSTSVVTVCSFTTSSFPSAFPHCSQTLSVMVLMKLDVCTTSSLELQSFSASVAP